MNCLNSPNIMDHDLVIQLISRGISKKKSSKAIDSSDSALLSEDAALALATEMMIDSGAPPRPAPVVVTEPSSGGKKSAPAANPARSSSNEEAIHNPAPAPVRRISTAQSESRLKSSSPSVIARKGPGSATVAKAPASRTPRAGAKPAGEDEDELAAFFKRKKEVSQNKSVRF
jgi:hypothetical protein